MLILMTRAGNTTGLMIFFVLLGLWCGSLSAKLSKENWKSTLISRTCFRLNRRVTTGGIIFLVGTLDAADINISTYFAQLSRPAIQLFIYAKTPLSVP